MLVQIAINEESSFRQGSVHRSPDGAAHAETNNAAGIFTCFP